MFWLVRSSLVRSEAPHPLCHRRTRETRLHRTQQPEDDQLKSTSYQAYTCSMITYQPPTIERLLIRLGREPFARLRR